MSDATAIATMTMTIAAPRAIRRATAGSYGPLRWPIARTIVAPPTIAMAMTENHVTASYGSSVKGSTAWMESTWVVTRTSRKNAALVAAPVHVTNRRSCFAAISSSITAASYSGSIRRPARPRLATSPGDDPACGTESTPSRPSGGHDPRGPSP